MDERIELRVSLNHDNAAQNFYTLCASMAGWPIFEWLPLQGLFPGLSARLIHAGFTLDVLVSKSEDLVSPHRFKSGMPPCFAIF